MINCVHLEKSNQKPSDNLEKRDVSPELISVLLGQSRWAEATSIALHYVQQYPTQGYAWKALGTCYLAQKQFESAESTLIKAIQLEPLDPESYNNLGLALDRLGKSEQALENYNKAVELLPTYAEAFSNRGNFFTRREEFSQAMADFDKALQLKPSLLDALFSKAVCLKELGKYHDALSNLDTVLIYKPHDLRTKWKKAIVLLTVGDYAAGWPLYELRRTQKEGLSIAIHGAEPWDGSKDLRGRTVLLCAEQGLGDTIQFSRYAKLVAERGATVWLEVPKALFRLLANLEGVSRAFPLGEVDGRFDFYCSLMSLPLAFNTTLQTIPLSDRYLKPSPRATQRWQHLLGVKQQLRVGLVWQGAFRAEDPDSWAVNDQRNIPIELLAQYLDPLELEFVNLQKGLPAEAEIITKQDQLWRVSRFINHAELLTDFAETGALIQTLDLVISVDTSTAHLAGALGKPIWLLNRFNTCWRWLVKREDSPWYASLRLFRQGPDRQWEPVVRRIAEALLVWKNNSQRIRRRTSTEGFSEPL